MSRSNIDINDELVERVMVRYQLKTKREAVDYALRHLILAVVTRSGMSFVTRDRQQAELGRLVGVDFAN